MAKYTLKDAAFFIDKADDDTFVKIGQAYSITPPSFAVDEVETTDLESVTHEYRPGLTDPGEVTIEIQHDPADINHAFLLTLAQTPQVLPMRVSLPTLPAAKLWTFSAYLSSFEPSGGENSDVMTASATFRVVSAVVETTAA